MTGQQRREGQKLDVFLQVRISMTSWRVSDWLCANDIWNSLSYKSNFCLIHVHGIIPVVHEPKDPQPNRGQFAFRRFLRVQQNLNDRIDKVLPCVIIGAESIGSRVFYKNMSLRGCGGVLGHGRGKRTRSRKSNRRP
jgi:hypothetical protein